MKILITVIYFLAMLSPLAVAGKIHIQNKVVIEDDKYIEWATVCEGTELPNGLCLKDVYIVIRK